MFFKEWNLSLCAPKSFCTGGKKFVLVYIAYQNDSWAFPNEMLGC